MKSLEFYVVALIVLIAQNAAYASPTAPLPWRAIGHVDNTCPAIALRPSYAASGCLPSDKTVRFPHTSVNMLRVDDAGSGPAQGLLVHILRMERTASVSVSVAATVPQPGTVVTVVQRTSVWNQRGANYVWTWTSRRVRMGKAISPTMVDVGIGSDDIDTGALVFSGSALVAVVIVNSARTENIEILTYPIRAGRVIPGRGALAVPAHLILRRAKWVESVYGQ